MNELGRKSQNVEVEGFGNVQVFYEEAAFDSDVVLEAKRLFKPEEKVEGEKLSEEQVKVLKEHSIYDDAASLDIRFVDKKDNAVEVEPKSPVSVRISIDKKALPAEVSSDAISIHHLVENDETKAIEKVEVVVQSLKSQNDDVTELNEVIGSLTTEDKKETITKEFIVDSFSLYQINWNDNTVKYCPPIRFHYVDKNFNEIGPTVRIEKTIPTEVVTSYHNGQYYVDRNAHKHKKGSVVFFDQDPKVEKQETRKEFHGYNFIGVYPYNPATDNMDKIVHGDPRQNDYFDINYKYGVSQHDFNEGLTRIDNVGYTSPRTNEVITWYTLDKGETQYRSNCAHEFYFVYDLGNQTAQTITDEHEESNEKYITNNLDGTYDLTLTAKTSYKNKEKLDIIFLVDTTRSMNLPFNAVNGLAKYGEGDYDKRGNSRKDKVREQIAKLVDSLSQNENYDLQYGLVGFGGNRKVTIEDRRFVYNNVDVFNEKKEKINSYSVPIIGDNDLTIEDTPYKGCFRIKTAIKLFAR